MAAADPPDVQREMQRALIQRDQQSAEFSQPALRELHLRQSQDASPMRPDERVFRTRERDAYLLQFPSAAKPVTNIELRPLPLPGGPRHGVDPIPVQGAGG
jgi:hypothetical protein